EDVVELQPQAVEGRFPPVVIGHDEGEVAHQVRRIPPQDAALLQGFHHQRDVSLFEIANAAVHQLGAAAGSPLAEIAALEQQRRIAARGGIDRDADSGCAAADHNDVPPGRLCAEAVDHFRPCHYTPAAACTPRKYST